MIKDDEVPTDFLCPISQQLMLDPVVAEDGETYERETIQAYFAKSKPTNGQWRSPLHATDMGDRLVNNRRMKSAIEEFLAKRSHLKSEVYFSTAFVNETVIALKQQDEKALQRLVEKEPRLWEKALVEDKSLVALVCEQGNKTLLLWLLKQVKQQNVLLEGLSKDIDKLLLTCCRNAQLGAEGVKSWLEMLGWEGETLQQKAKAWLAAEQPELVQAIVQTQLIKVNSVLDNKEGNTLLHLAVQCKQPILVKWLMDNGADPKRPNAQSQRPEQLAEQSGNVELSKQIIQWRQAQKLAPHIASYTVKFESLERQNSELKKEALADQQALQELKRESNDQLAKAHKALEEQKEQMFLLRKMYEEKFTGLERQIKVISDEANLLKSRGFFASPQKKLTQQEQAKQNQFIEVLLKGDLEQAKQLYVQGVSLVAADKNGLYPLVAAAYSANPYLLKYIEDRLGKEADVFWAEVDSQTVKQKIKKAMPEKRPSDATCSWIAKWIQSVMKDQWWWKGSKGYKKWMQRPEIMGMKWTARDEKVPVEVLESLMPYWNFDAEKKRRSREKWMHNQTALDSFSRKDDTLCWPTPERHDEYVKTLTEQLEALEKYCLDKIAQAKKEIRPTIG